MIGLDGKEMIPDDDIESIDAKDYLLDFANVDYVTKNIRVKSVNEQNGIEEKSEHTSKHNMLGDKTDDEEEKFNQEAIHDLDESRR